MLKEIIIPISEHEQEQTVNVDSKLDLKIKILQWGKVIINACDAKNQKLFFTASTRSDNLSEITRINLTDCETSRDFLLIRIGDVRIYVSNFDMETSGKLDENYYINIRKGCGKLVQYVIPKESICRDIFGNR